MNNPGNEELVTRHSSLVTKICGLRTPAHALAAAAAGADMLGLNFAASRRRVSWEEAATIVAAVRSAGYRQVAIVGLFVNAEAELINATVESVGLDYIQLSGDEWPALVERLSRPVIAAIRMDGSEREAAWLAVATRLGDWAIDQSPNRPIAQSPLLLIDAHVPGSYGGTGTRADWAKAAVVARTYPLLLAGGLTPENVALAAQVVQPWAVDVSSGVETDGVKDIAKIEAFIGAARR
jgi:phosphoribosylanthranilate isomerase